MLLTHLSPCLQEALWKRSGYDWAIDSTTRMMLETEYNGDIPLALAAETFVDLSEYRRTLVKLAVPSTCLSILEGNWRASRLADYVHNA